MKIGPICPNLDTSMDTITDLSSVSEADVVVQPVNFLSQPAHRCDLSDIFSVCLHKPEMLTVVTH